MRKVLEDAGYKNIQIRSIVVFTNNRIEVQNKYNMIRTCFVSQLAHIIDGYRLEEVLSSEDMDRIQDVVESAACKENYPFEFNVQQYKIDFANLMVALEFANTSQEDKSVEEIAETTPVHAKESRKVKMMTLADVLKHVFASKQLRYAGSTAATVAITVVSTLIAVSTINKGGGRTIT